MTEKEIRPYGSWKSPISAAQVASGGRWPGQILVSDGIAYWSESRPEEGGRIAVMRRLPDGSIEEVTTKDFNCRTRVHEYGGGAYFVDGSTMYGSRFDDQRMYKFEPGKAPVAITPEPSSPASLRYADARITADGRRMYCVRERHEDDGSVINELVTLPTDGEGEQIVIRDGRDFYAAPRLSPDQQRLAWLEWDQPNMPWDGTEVWAAEITSDGGLENPRVIAGGLEESIFQPEWSPEGILHFVSDRSGWWNLYRFENGEVRAVAPMEAEFGSPMWNFGVSQYAFLSDGRIVSIFSQGGEDYLGMVDGTIDRLDLEFTTFRPRTLHYDSSSDQLFFVAGHPTRPARVYSLQLADGKPEPVSPPPDELPDEDDVSIARPITFPISDGLDSHAFYYPPKNKDYAGPEDELPPLIVISHGGPTSHTDSEFALARQFWTSRGIAVVDVNYRGSTGYGRAYRQLLNGEWGVADVEDCINAARYLAEQGEVDGDRLMIRGGSAGGYTTLCALAFHDAFSAGASYYGVADAEALAKDTHKFEARYLDSMIGPYPEAVELYRERSPIHYVDQITAPLILLQGGEDRVVPQAQAEMMVDALDAKGIPHAYLLFEEEAHGFRDANNIVRALEGELYFYSRIFGFELGNDIEPIEIKNLSN